MLLILAFAFPG